MQDGVLAISAHRCIGITDVSSRAITRPAGAVIPAARILGNIAADRPLIPDLGGCDHFACLCQHSEFLPYDGILCNFGERGHRSNMHTIRSLAGTPEFVDAAQVDNHLWLPDTVF